MSDRDTTPGHPPRGRPKAAQASSSVSTWIPNRDYDKLIKLAQKQEQSVSSLVRDLLKLKL